MPAAITLKDISWSTPDGHTLFDHLDLAFGPGRTGLIGRNGVGKSTILKIVTGEIAPRAGTLDVNGRVGMLRQWVQLSPDETVADAFECTGDLALLAAIEAGTADPAAIADADWTLEARMQTALAQIGLPHLPADRPLASLSGGQRTRVFLAALVFKAPDMILLDEPTNNLDAGGRDAVIAVLRGWRGGAVVVSHDRAVLEEMDTIVELTGLGARSYGGNWSVYEQRKAIELAAARHQLDSAERKLSEVEARSQITRERKARRDGAGKRKRARNDTPRILLNAMQNRSEQTGGSQARMAERMREQASAAAQEARAQIESLQPLTVRLASAGLPAGKTILEASGLTGGHDPAAPAIRDFSLHMVGPERVAITGPNGSGKTTLLKLLTGALPPLAGTVRINGRHAVLDQHMSLLDPALSIRNAFLAFNPDADENACRAALARFLFRADAALQPVGSLSGGEMLRAGLAAVLGGARPPQLLILDEPTNHLDIHAIAAMEAGLAAYDGALLVVSHDEAFLKAIGITSRIAL